MDLSKCIEEKKFDVRLIEHNLKTNTLTKEEYQKYLSQLPDLSSACEKLTLDESEAGNGADYSSSNQFQN